MKTFKTLGAVSLAVAGLVGMGCEKRETRTTTTTTTSTPSADTSATTTTPAAPTTAPADRVPGTMDRQPVSGTDTTSTVTTTTTEIYVMGEDGQRIMLHDSGLISDLQRKLKAEGLYMGEIDGKTSPELASALRQYQTQKNMTQTDALDRTTAERLGLEWNRFTASAEQKAEGIGSDVKRVSGEAATDLKEGAKAIKEDIKRGAAEGAGAVEEGARDVKKELDPATNPNR
jgi:hypothetical protein